MPTVTIETEEERTVLVEALNCLKEKYAEREKKGGNHVRNARHRQGVAEEIAGRVPPVKAFPRRETGGDDHNKLVFFENCGTSFKSVTPRSFLGTRKAGDIKVSRRFRVNLESSELTVKESYYFDDYCAKEYERDLGRVQNVKRYTDHPLWSAKKDGTRLEDYCQSVHASCIRRDDANVARILTDDPSLDEQMWRMYRRDIDRRPSHNS